MGQDTRIEWARHTFNPWVGCTKISPACDNCYAESWAKRAGSPELWTGERRRTTPANWRKPLQWNLRAGEAGRRDRVFCASLADVFDNQVPAVWRHDLWALIAATPHLDWLLLTKRPQNIMKMLPASWPLANVWLGTTAEDEKRYRQRWAHVAAVEATVRFLSYEPALGPISDLDLGRVGAPNWVIVGGESGPKARPMHPDWARSVRDQCQGAGVPYFFKQWGEWTPWEWHVPPDMRSQDGRWMDSNCIPHTEAGELASGWSDDCLYDGEDGCIHERIGKKRAGRLLDGREWNEFPAPLRAAA